MAFEGLSNRLQEITRKIRGKSKNNRIRFKRNVKRG